MVCLTVDGATCWHHDECSDQAEARGWPDSSYAVSKMAAFAYTLLAGRDEYFARSDVLVNAVCPGCCSTAVTMMAGRRSARKGAKTVLWLATAPREDLSAVSGEDGITGRIYRDKLPFVGYEHDWRCMDATSEGVLIDSLTQAHTRQAQAMPLVLPAASVPTVVPS
jgi:hypothetical protein